MADELHRILSNQLLQHFGSNDAIPRALVPFIRSVNRAYHELDCGYDRDTSTQDREQVLRRYQTAMLNLVELDTMELESAFKKLTRVAAEMFNVERVSIWTYDAGATAIACRTLYIKSRGAYDAGARLLAKDYPAYFKSLAESLVIAAANACADPRTREFADTYLRPLGISSMMDVPVRHRGKVAGILCHEHIGPARVWSVDEQEMAGALSELITLAIESDDRKKTEGKLERLLSIQETMLETTGDGIAVSDSSGRILSYNKRFQEMWRLPDEILATCSVEKALAFVKDQLVDPDEYLTRARAVLTEMRPENFDVLEFKDGRVYERYSRPQKLNGQTVGRVISYRDVTERRRSEMREEELRTRLARAARMESLGLLAGGVAHDLNNILGPLVGYPDLVLDQLPADCPVRGDIQEMKESSIRAAAIIQDLLTMARRGNYKPEPVSLNDVVESYLVSAGFRHQKARYPHVEIQVKLDPDMMPVQGSMPHLCQVAMNLVINALEAMPSPGRLTVETACEYIDLPVRAFDTIAEGEYAVLRVIDSGVGIQPADIERIFEPFYTRKEMGRSGTGLGLAVVYGVVKDMHGFIDVKSSPGKGSEFSMYFPISRAAIDVSDTSCSSYRGDKVILVVDDIKEQRHVAEKLLSMLGYVVVTVADAAGAINFMRQQKADLVILDMILGNGMDGLDVYKSIVEIRPRQPCIIVSGFSESERVREAQALGAGEYLRKPFTRERIAKAVWEALHPASESGGNVQHPTSNVQHPM